MLKRGMTQTGLTLRHFLLALAVVAIWGSNFVVIRIGLNHLPPLLFAAMRFCLVFLPAALFLKRPNVPLKQLAGYGLLIGAGQFGLLFMAMKGHITPGIASLVIQTQVFFTIGLSMLINREKLAGVQLVSLGLAAGLINPAAGAPASAEPSCARSPRRPAAQGPWHPARATRGPACGSAWGSRSAPCAAR